MTVRLVFTIVFGVASSVTAPFITHAQLKGSIQYADIRCGLGVTEPNHPDALPQGAECMRTPVGDNEALGLECDGIANPVVISKCDASKCLAKIGCDGKPLTGAPDVPDSGTTNPPSGGAGSSGSSGSSGGSGGTLPSGSDPLDAFEPPSGEPLPGGSVDPTGGAAVNPDGSVVLPEVEVVTPQAPSPTQTKPQVPTGKPSVLEPKRPASTFGEGGVFSGGNPFEHLTTFGASGISSTIVSPVVGSVFSGLLPSVIDFFGNLFGINSAPGFSGGNGGNTSVPRPGPVVASNNPQTPPPKAPSLSGGPAQPVTDNPPNDIGNPIRPPYDVNPFTPPKSPPEEEILPSVDIVTAEIDTGTVSDVSPKLPQYPLWWDEGTVLPNRFAEGLEQGLPVAKSFERARTIAVEGAFSGLVGGRIGADDPEVATARRILEEDVARAEYALDLAYETRALPFREWIDRTPWLPDFIKSNEYRALQDARSEQRVLSEAEGLVRLRANAGELEAAEPEFEFDEANAISVFGTGPGTLSGLVAERIRSALGFESETPPQEVPEVVTPGEGLLSGLSAIAQNVREVFGNIQERFNFPGASRVEIPTQVAEVPPPPPSIPTAPTPPPPVPTPPPSVSEPQDSLPSAPETEEAKANSPPKPPAQSETPPASETPPEPRASAQQSNSGFIQGGMQIMGTLIKALASFFTPPGANSANPSPAKVEPRTTPVATITANPIEIASGKTTQLSWSSVGAQSCAVVDALSRVIARGANGKVQSPLISETTRFAVICDIERGEDKFINEVLVRVEGSASTTPPLFSNSGRASSAVSSSGTGGTSASGESSVAPIDVRTCDPEQSIDAFIACLCEAEPNPAGCSVSPRGM